MTSVQVNLGVIGWLDLVPCADGPEAEAGCSRSGEEIRVPPKQRAGVVEAPALTRDNDTGTSKDVGERRRTPDVKRIPVGFVEGDLGNA